jgi:branched-chain amino acid transport system permease protein
MATKPHWLVGIAGLAVLLVLPPFLRSYGIYLLSYWLVFVIATMGLNLTVGYAGQTSLGQAAFLGIGAYSVAIVMKAGGSFWLGLPLSAVRCGCRRSIWRSRRWGSMSPRGWSCATRSG